ncbi:bifunctional serine/threonine-protein kinase/formylglycine-generating enzyme family protein [Aestuariicella hydrocarbonica]
MSTVYLAIQLSVGREVALKVMSPALNADPVFSERFQREANIVGQLSHPNIVSIYDIGRFKNLNYIAMDYLAGGSAHDKMSQGLSANEALRITEEIANALDHAHEKGYIHRDIKPENILFREDDTAVLSDFGVAKTVSTASRMTNAGTVVGTPHYMSPEQARGKPIDGRSDLYSLGVVFYEMLTGSVPYQAEEAIAIAIKHLTAPIPKLPGQYSLFQPLLNKLLAKEPDDRFQRGREVVESIQTLQGTRNNTNPRYLTETDPNTIQILSLLKALILTSFAAISSQVQAFGHWVFSWRWTPRRGIYRHPKVTVTEIRTSADTAEDNRATIVSTRIQKAAHYQTLPSRRLGTAMRGLSLAVILSLIWVALSMAISRFDVPFKASIPEAVVKASDVTNDLVNSVLQSSQPPEPETSVADTPALADDAAEAIEVTAGDETVLEEVIVPTTPSMTPPVTPPPPRRELSVNASPIDAKVRILNIREPYYPGIPLLPGRYHIEVTSNGYDTYREWIELDKDDTELTVSLRKIPVPGATFYNELAGGRKGPSMVIVPAGRFTMGDAGNSTASPTHQVRLKNPFAVSQYEITFADFEHFAKATKRPLPDSNRWGKGSRPVINVSWQDAKDYVAWLRKTTDRKYRLPTEAEWEYFARAGTKGNFWWQGSSAKKANCRRGCESDFSNFFRSKTAPVGTFPSNPFKIFDTSGNVAEWVEDCYQDHYLGAPKDGSAVEQNNCSMRSVRGGSMRSSDTDTANFIRDKRNPDIGYSDVGFRVVVDLY